MTKAREIASVPETVLLSGTISSGTTAINLTNSLSNTYKFYRLHLYAATNTSAQDIFIRCRENTTDVTSAYYGGGGRGNYLNSLSSNFSANNGSGITIGTVGTGTNYGASIVTIYRPDATSCFVTTQHYDRFSLAGGFSAHERTSMTNFNGITIYPNAQSFSAGYYILTGIRV